jgi:hypothetical protein
LTGRTQAKPPKVGHTAGIVLGVTGVAVGISAIYVAGLTAATASVPKCAVAPVPMHGGGGLAAALSF